MNSEHVDRKTGADTELNVLYEKIMQKHNEWLYHESYLGASENVTSLKYSPFADAISFCSDKENNYAGKVQKYRHDKRNNVTHYIDEGQQDVVTTNTIKTKEHAPMSFLMVVVVVVVVVGMDVIREYVTISNVLGIAGLVVIVVINIFQTIIIIIMGMEIMDTIIIIIIIILITTTMIIIMVV